MKKLVIALTALAAFTASASAADLAARPYTKAPMMAPAYSWTGFYIFGGIGGGLWDSDTTIRDTVTGANILGVNQKQGGDGWFGTVGAGYDWQFGGSWVAGILADGQFGSLKGTIQDQGPFLAGREKLRDTWAVGARIGYLVAPNVLSYVNGGYTGSSWSGTTLVNTATGAASGLHTNGFDRNGWFMKTEYRAAYYDSKNINELFDGTNVSNGRTIHMDKPLVQTISTSLVYRFNWGGPVVARY